MVLRLLPLSFLLCMGDHDRGEGPRGDNMYYIEVGMVSDRLCLAKCVWQPVLETWKTLNTVLNVLVVLQTTMTILCYGSTGVRHLQLQCCAHAAGVFLNTCMGCSVVHISIYRVSCIWQERHLVTVII